MMKVRRRLRVAAILLIALSAAAPLAAQDRQAVDEQRRKAEELRDYIKANYTKNEYMAPMRDGIHLFVAVYAPKDHSKQYPIWMQRTPYSVAPYGVDNYRGSLGPCP
jgi:predicted acyl esterase